MRKRTKARELALQVLYQLDLRGDEVRGDLAELLGNVTSDPEILDFARRIIDGTWERRAEIDKIIESAARNWEIRRMAAIDRNILLGTFASATTADVDAAVAAARAAQPAWAATPWQERLRILRRAAELISDRLMDYAAIMAYEVGKNRIEALGEVEESADLIRYYSQTMEDNEGYDHPMGNLGDASVHTRSVLRPHGVFAVISPFNFPMALAAGPTSAAMMAGTSKMSSAVLDSWRSSPLTRQRTGVSARSSSSAVTAQGPIGQKVGNILPSRLCSHAWIGPMIPCALKIGATQSRAETSFTSV